ncbi:MAG TPA: hypothetical protein PLL30_11980 [Candidatus Krumholzibacteria bacterium]|nr:hypothetical protein [Candidatus Krumholzibacteria bacterium]HPD72486.1 hypothetical protein [Candidatus Krumholzibacteria bacterium]HRY40582.1 hypothetical protein [Candidatus Krumholzibacteria bacterium]
MSRLRLGLLLTLIGSLALGVIFGIIFHRLFLSNVPQQWLSSFQANTAPFSFIGTGLVLGVLIWGWAVLVASLAPRFRRRPDKP